MNTSRNYIKNSYATAGNYLENMSSSRKIILLVSTAILLFAVFYWAFNANKNHLQNMKYQRLVTKYATIDQLSESITENVHGSPNGYNITLSFWLNVKNFTPEQNAQYTMNQLISLSDIINIGIDRSTNNLQINILQSNADNSSTPAPIELENIPFYTWTHYIVTVMDRYVNIYQNGKLIKTTILNGMPITMNNYTITTNAKTNNSNFVAELGNLYYFGKMITKDDIAILVNQIPQIPRH